MQWINHHDPILEIHDDDGQVTEKVSLDQYGYDAMFELLDNKGFARK